MTKTQKQKHENKPEPAFEESHHRSITGGGGVKIG